MESLKLKTLHMLLYSPDPSRLYEVNTNYRQYWLLEVLAISLESNSVLQMQICPDKFESYY